MIAPSKIISTTPPEFEAVLTDGQLREMEVNYENEWGERRRLMQITLSRSSADLLKGFLGDDISVLRELIAVLGDYRQHLLSGLDLTEGAIRRLESVAAYKEGNP